MTDADQAAWIRDVQSMTEEWRAGALEGEPTPATQAAHTAVEAGELLDLLVKDATYRDENSGELLAVDDEVLKEAGDVVVAHLGTLSLLGYDAGEVLGEAPERDHPHLDTIGRAVELQYKASALAELLTTMPEGQDPGGLTAKSLAAGVFATQRSAAEALGFTVEASVEAALEKNGARDWAEHQRDATGR